MGLEFIRITAKPHVKAWRAEFLKAESDLFAGSCSSISRTYIASVSATAPCKEADIVHLRCVGDQVIVFKELFPVGQIDKPTFDLTESLHTSGGILDACVDELDLPLGTAAIRVLSEKR